MTTYSDWQTQSPILVGVYETTQLLHEMDLTPTYQYWDGKEFKVSCYSVKKALSESGKTKETMLAQPARWRGILDD